MLVRIIDASLRHRGVVLAATGALVLAGLLSFRALPFDAFPETTPTQVQVNAVAPALTPTEMERQLTVPMEQALAGLPRAAELRSLSKFGFSQITIQFEDGTDLWFARQQVAERLATVALPEGVAPPTLGPVATGLGEVFHYVVSSDTRSLESLRTLHDTIVAPQLRSVPGVAEVNAWGGEERQWHVVVDPLRLQRHGLTVGDVYAALEGNGANVGGGVIERGGAASLVVGVAALDGAEEVEAVVVAARGGVPVRVRDVARVEVGSEIRRGAVTADGRGEVVLGLGFMLIGESSHEVTRRLEARFDEVRKGLPEDVKAEVVYERTELVDQVLRTVEKNLLEGALLVVAVLFVFLGNLRAGLIVAAAIPLSMLFAFAGMLKFGIAGSLMSLGAIDFGLLVDSSVITVENAERRLREAPPERSVREVVRDAAVEVRKPTLFGELIILIVYLPILALTGIEGKMFRPMALTVVFALIGSAVVSMTLMPVLASWVLKRGAHREEPRLVRWLKRGYAPVLGWALAHGRVVVAAAVLVVLAAAGAATRLGSEFIPRLSEGTIVINTVRLAEVSLAESVRYGSLIEQRLLERFPDEVRRVWTRTGTAEIATDPMGVELSDVFVALHPRERWKRAGSQEELARAMERELAALPGMRMAYLQPIELRVNEMIAGVRSDVGVKVFGDDLDLLRAKAKEIEAVVRSIPGAADVSVEQVTGQPVLQIEVDRAALARHGIPARDVLDVVEAVGSRVVGEVREGDRRRDLAVRLDEPWRSDPERLATVPVAAPGGERIPLGRLVAFRETTGPTTIQREWGQRRVVVQANVRGRDLGGFVDEVRRRVDAEVELPTGYHVRLGGQFENLERAQRRLLVVVPLALALILALLWLTYRRVVDALRIFVGVPFAMVGGVLALLARDLPFSISAAVGFVALSGVSVLGDMVLVSRIRQLLDEGVPLHDAVREAALSRVRPVLMTAAVAAIGFVPMAVNTGVGAEVQRPLATVVIGGIVSSTLLTLLVLPVLYVLLARRRGSGEAPLRAVAALALLAFAAPAFPADRPIALEDARRLALERSPEVLRARADVAAARGRLEAARLPVPENPELEVAAGPRTAGSERTTDVEVAISQRVELAGQRGARTATARAALAAAEAGLRATRAAVEAGVRAAYGRVLAAQARAALADEAAAVARDAHGALTDREREGDASRLELNAALVERGRAERVAARGPADLAEALAAFRAAVGSEDARPEGTLEALGSARPAAVVEGGAERPEVAQAREALQAARAARDLARRAAFPDVTLGAAYAREERADVVLGTVGVALPLFHRNQAERADASAEVTRAEAALAAAEQRARAEVEQARARAVSARAAVAAFDAGLLAAARENVALAGEGYAEGKLGFLELLLVRRDALETRREHVDALEELNAAEAELERVAPAAQP